MDVDNYASKSQSYSQMVELSTDLCTNTHVLFSRFPHNKIAIRVDERNVHFRIATLHKID